MTESKTPRTDSSTLAMYDDGRPDYVLASLARQLERELAAMTRERDDWRRKSEIDQLQCDEMTSMAAKLATENAELRKRVEEMEKSVTPTPSTRPS